MPTLNDVHKKCVNGDRMIRIIGVVRGYWYEDRVLDVMNEYGHRECTVIDENDVMITVRVK